MSDPLVDALDRATRAMADMAKEMGAANQAAQKAARDAEYEKKREAARTPEQRAYERIDKEQAAREEEAAYQKARHREGLTPWSERLFGKGGFQGAVIGGAGIHYAATAIQQVAHGLSALGNSFLDARQKVQSIVESIPVLGTLMHGLRELGEAVSGTADVLRRQAMAFSLRGAEEPATLRNVQEEGALRMRGAGLAAVAAARERQAQAGLAGAGLAAPRGAALYDPLMMGRFGRQLGLAQTRLTHEAELAGLQAEAEKIQGRGVQLDAVRSSLRDDLAAAKAREEAIRAEPGWGNAGIRGAQAAGPVGFAAGHAAETFGFGDYFTGGYKGRLDEAMRERVLAAEKLELIEEQIAGHQKETQASQAALAQKRKELAQDDLAMAREKLGVLREQEGILRGTASSFYRMVGGEREMLLAWKKQADEKGFDSLLPTQVDDMVSMGGGAGSVVGRWAERNIAQLMDKDPGFKEFAKVWDDPALKGGPLGIGQNLREQARLEKEIWEMSHKVEAKAAASFNAAFDNFLDRLIKAMDGKVTAAVARLEGQLRHQQAGLQ